MYREAPEDDGGTPIKHFVTEILDFTTNNMWTSVAMSETGDCREQLLEHLLEGHRYCFRVAAANKIGQSEPRETKGEIITKDPWGKKLFSVAFFSHFSNFRCSKSLWQGTDN